MSKLLEFFNDMRDNGYGLAEIAAQLGTSASGKTPKEVDTIRDKDKNIIVTTKPENIRSRFAAFDPFNRDSANLLAQYGAIAPTTALGAYMYNEKRKKSQGNQ